DHQGELISTYLQKKAQDFINDSLYRLDNNNNTLKLQNKNLQQENKHLTKYKAIAAICRTNQIQPAQFQRVASKLFKINNKEYSTKFVKLATDISNMGQTSIRATNNEVAALSCNQNCPTNTCFRFFDYGIMVDESTRGEMKT
ncbi:10731_t:CDS:2, partial [Dentiscutata erythropus]